MVPPRGRCCNKKTITPLPCLFFLSDSVVATSLDLRSDGSGRTPDAFLDRQPSFLLYTFRYLHQARALGLVVILRQLLPPIAPIAVPASLFHRT